MMRPSGPLRVRIHLNLAKPELAENAVRVQSPSGNWSTVAYATSLMLQQCVPVVDIQAQDRVRRGVSRKVPHAYLEGDLLHFEGRLRTLAPTWAKQCVQDGLPTDPGFASQVQTICSTADRINYNPRFARRFYKDQPDRDQIREAFEGSEILCVVGWRFWGHRAHYTLLDQQDYCEPQAILRASGSEKSVLRRGHFQTDDRVAQLLSPSMKKPR